MERRNILILNRWSDDFAAYEKIVDHELHTVIYLVNAAGKQGIRANPEHVEKIIEVEDLTDIDNLYRVCLPLLDEYGRLDRLIAASEFDLLQAAILRTKLGIPGIQEEQVALYKDKVAMKERMMREGLRVPHFLDPEDAQQVTAFADEVGYPLILKPKSGAASHGVHRIADEQELLAVLPTVDLADYECEEYVDGPIFHVDGLVRDGKFEFVKVSQYINTCLDFNLGVPLGSFMIEEGPLNDELTAFTAATVQALELVNSAFHLEIILKDGVEPVFLEIGARVGGGEIPFLYQELYGVDLIEQWLKIELGQFTGMELKETARCGGFLMVPEPANVPCEVVAAPSLVGEIPTLFHEVLPAVGAVLDGTGGYEEISGRFLFRGDSVDEIVRDIKEAIARFSLETKPAVPQHA